MSNKEVEVVFQPEGKRAKVPGGTNLLECADEAGVDIKSDCGGKQVCGKCKVIIEEGADSLSSPTSKEREELGEDLDEGYRLACAAEVGGNVLATVPDESRRGKQVILTEGLEVDFEIDPPLKKYRVEPETPSLADDTPDFERMRNFLNSEYGTQVEDIEHSTLKKLPRVLRDNMGRYEETFTASVLDNNLIRLEKGQKEDYYGVAVDIGTTTVVAYLTDMRTGEVISISSTMNPQVKYGEDVMRRVTMSFQEENGMEKLNKVIVEGLNDLLGEVCEDAGITRDDIMEVTVVGNTGMHNLFVGIHAEFVSKSPYVQAVGRSLDLTPKESKIDIYEGGNVHVLPTIAGWMGADTVGCLITTTPYEQKETQLMIDVGTNGELVLGNEDRLIGASTAAGPALEGAHVKHGMRAAPGAIQYVRIDPSTYEPKLDIIENEPARGLCGSGIIDIVAEMVRTGILQQNGRFNKDLETDRVRKSKAGKGNEYVAVWAEDSGIDKDIVISLEDVREVQLAKGAIRAGSNILMDEFGVETVDEIALAGAFGNYIDPTSALIIGLFPEIDRDKVNMVGNAAGIGSRLALIDEEKRKEAEWLVDEVKYYRLAAHEGFDMSFAKAQWFPHTKKDELYPNYDEILALREEESEL
ncbi:ferredoxin [candidate division MSBL1 archaeon SCGC-AAA382A20]|uniref:Ferredoxin n=1 Tax=candidate division MSBL1 archaeon SCGC-AAA382A20 TaxID=1698280 RepID=A0A133VIG2_9EURY|nr:ferredoxin [candidate division MSBL1 archaeon SCGC-AAA382A20]